MAIATSSGYPQYSGNLIHPMVAADLLERFYCTTIFGEISTTEYTGDLMRCGDQITFWREPEVEIHDYKKNAPLKSDTLESCPISMTIDKAKYFNLKIDWIDEKQICNWDTWKDAFLRRASYNLGQIIDQELLNNMYAEVHPCNMGPNAGVLSQCYNLGEPGAPVALTPDNIIDALAQKCAVLDEQCIPDDRFIILPPIAKVLLMNSPYGESCFLNCGGGESPAVNGKLPGQLLGMDVYISNNAPKVKDAGTNQDAYWIMFGHRSATAFASQIEETRVIEDKDSFDRYYQGLQVYGCGVMRPEALGACYATFEKK